MRDPSKRAGWLDKIPGWLKGAVGLVGTIAAFVIAFRDNWRLYLTITVILVMAYLFGLSLYLILKRRKLRSRKAQWVFLPVAYRLLGLLGLVMTFVVFTGLILVQPTRQVALEGIFGTPTPIPPPQLAAPDVLIAPFDSSADSPYQVEHWLQESLQEQLHQYDLDNITVHVGETPIGSESQAQDAANNTGSKVVIWGWYDPKGIQVKIFLSGGEESGTLLPGTKVIPLQSAGVPDSNLSVVITEVLPENVNFLSLFVIGHLEYLSDNYQMGYRAFDAAMAQMPPPEKVTIQNQAILHFFRARQMEHDGSAAQDVICEYAKALELDPQFDVANNNLGIVISKSIVEQNAVGELSFIKASRPCLEQAGLHEDILDLPRLLFERAANANPRFLIAKYNQYGYLWSRDMSLHSDPEIRSVMEDIQRQDPSILGTYIILAVSKDRGGDPAGAIQMYRSGIAVEPDLPFFHMNLGQLYLSHEKNEVEAENEFLKTLELDPNHELARLALGHLYFRQGRLPEATTRLQQVVLADDPNYDLSYWQLKALVLLSTISFAQDQPMEAIEEINLAFEKSISDQFLFFLLGLLYQHQGQNDLAAEYFSQAGQGNLYVTQTVDEWGKFAERCFTEETSSMPFADWALTRFPLSNCLPSNPKERILAFYELSNEGLFALRDQPRMIFIGARCPYLYTADPITGEWEFETTILYEVVDREAAQLRPLTQFNGKLLIREQEPEVSYLNRLYVIAKMSDGSLLILEPDVEALKQADADYVILHQGEEVLVTLDDYPITGEVSQWWVMAVGYYTSLPK